MFVKTSLFIDSGLAKRMSQDSPDGKQLRDSPGFWEASRVTSHLLQIGQTRKSYNGPHDFSRLNADTFEYFCTCVQAAHRVETTIRLARNNASPFILHVNFFTPKKGNEDGLILQLMLSTHLWDGMTTLYELARKQ